MYIVGHLVSVKTATMKSIFPSNQEHLQLYKFHLQCLSWNFSLPLSVAPWSVVAYHPGSATVKRGRSQSG